MTRFELEQKLGQGAGLQSQLGNVTCIRARGVEPPPVLG